MWREGTQVAGEKRLNIYFDVSQVVFVISDLLEHVTEVTSAINSSSSLMVWSPMAGGQIQCRPVRWLPSEKKVLELKMDVQNVSCRPTGQSVSQCHI